MTIKIGIVGCGAIGKVIARAVDRGDVPGAVNGAICDRKQEPTEQFCATLKQEPPVLPLTELVQRVDLVVECASAAAVPDVATAALNAGRDLMLLSVGALHDEELLSRLREKARDAGRSIYLPSGAIAGLDGIKAAGMAGLDEVVLTTRKPPRSLMGAPGLDDEDFSSLTGEKIIFEGPASEAVKLLPANVNVAASLSLAGIGFERTLVRVVVDPEADRNEHHLVVTGEFGRLEVKVQNVQCPDNPRTSYLAALSAIATLKYICEPIKVGT